MTIPYGMHYIDEDDIQAVTEVLRHGMLTQGALVQEFEKKIAEYVGAQYAVVMSSWTAGLHLTCLAVDLRPGDIVITSPMSFVASSNCALYAGATPAFADIDPETLNMDPTSLEKECRRLGRVKMIIPVHFAGLPCDMEAITAVAKKYNAVVVEDAAHALGALDPQGGRIGHGKSSLMTGFSFHPVKTIACGEGGVITTNNKDIYQKLIRLRSHGINKGDDQLINTSEAYTHGEKNPWYYEMHELGLNYRLTDIQCALGLSQFRKLESFIARRIQIAQYYDKQFQDLKNLRIIHYQKREGHGNHLYLVRVNFDKIKKTRCQLISEMKNMGVQGHVHYLPIPMHPYYQNNFQIPQDSYKEALNYYREALTLPLYPSMKDEQVERVVSTVKALIG